MRGLSLLATFTNMPYVLDAGESCGQSSVDSGYYAGRLDGSTVVLGHEVEETTTDPGAEGAIDGQSLAAGTTTTGTRTATSARGSGTRTASRRRPRCPAG